MPRTIENIVECHRVARVRVAAGRPVWDHKVDIKQFLRRDPSNDSSEHAMTVAREIAAELRRCLPASMIDDDYELTEIVEQLEQCTDFDEDWTALQDLNARLDELYDWADKRRVWLGL